MSTVRFFLAVCLVVLLCGPAHARPTLLVSAAASLTDAFTDAAAAFEEQHDVTVTLNFAASGALFRQLEMGAPADVYASANPKWMDRAVEEGFVDASTRVDFARNTLVLAVPANNPAQISGAKDLTGPRVTRIGIGTPATVPAGRYAQEALTLAGLWETLVPKYIYAESVRQVLDYLSRGEVDAGFVYRTDAVRAGDSVGIVSTMALKRPVTYPIGVVAGSQQRKLAEAFVDFMTSPEGAAYLQARGFSPAGEE